MVSESFLYSLVKDFIALIRKRFGKPDGEELAKKRQQLKKEFEDHLHWCNDDSWYGEAIVRDVKRIDSYPEIEEGNGISPWFKVQLLGLYHRGIEVGLRIEAMKYDEQQEQWHLTDDYANKTLNGIVVGRIAFESIVSVDWSGDEYYGDPHIYCYFNGKKDGPYEEIIISEKKKSPNMRPFLIQLTTYDDANKLKNVLEKRK